MEQFSVEPIRVQYLSGRLEHVELPQHLRYERPRLGPPELSPYAGARAETELRQPFDAVVGEYLVVEKMRRRQVPFRPEMYRVMEIFRASAEGKDASLNGYLE